LGVTLVWQALPTFLVQGHGSRGGKILPYKIHDPKKKGKGEKPCLYNRWGKKIKVQKTERDRQAETISDWAEKKRGNRRGGS